MNNAYRAAARAHQWLAFARRSIKEGRIAEAQAAIRSARVWWRFYQVLAHKADISVAARRVAGDDGKPRWRPCIHVKGGEVVLTLSYSLKTYAHRQSADRAANKVLKSTKAL